MKPRNLVAYDELLIGAKATGAKKDWQSAFGSSSYMIELAAASPTVGRSWQT